MAKGRSRRPESRLDRAAAITTPRGRPREAEPWRKVTVVLKDRQILFLDRLALDIRAATGAAVARAEIIRALIDAVEAAKIDLTDATSEDEVRNIVLERLK